MGQLDGLRKALEAKTARVANQVARDVVRDLQRVAPVESGELRSMIDAQVKATMTGAEITLESNAVYAQFNREHREEWDQMVRQLPDRIERVWRSTP